MKPVPKAESNRLFISSIQSTEIDRLPLKELIRFSDKFMELGCDLTDAGKTGEILLSLIQTPADSLTANLSAREAVIALLLLRRTNSTTDYPDLVSNLFTVISGSSDPESKCRTIGFLRKDYPTLSKSIVREIAVPDVLEISAEAVVHLVSADPPNSLLPALGRRWLTVANFSTKAKLIIAATVAFSKQEKPDLEICTFFESWLKTRPALNHQDRLGAAEIFRRVSLARNSAAFLVDSPEFQKTPNPSEFLRILTAVSGNLEISTLDRLIGNHFRQFSKIYKPEDVEIVSLLLQKKRKPRGEILDS